jgi:membrane protease subunit (stomatin/prohibitin family)
VGLLDKLRGELIDIVEWMDDDRHTLVWRFPRYHNQIKNGAQLIVRPGQTAIFVHQGKVADVFEPGQYRLETKNLPVLSTLQGWAHGFESPFKAEVYFVATRQITELKWGTPNPIIVRDPDFGPIRVRAFGTYTLRASDPRAILRELVGTDVQFESEEIGVFLRSIIGSVFADLVATTGISITDLASNYATLSEELRKRVVARVDDEYGLDLPQLYIVNVSLPEEVERALDARSSMGILGDLDRYQQYQIGASTPDAARNPAGGIAGAGLGLGMGMVMANGMTFPGGPGTPPAGGGSAALASPVSPPPPPAVAWYVAEGGRSLGPFGEAQIAEAVRSGRLAGSAQVWSVGMAGWAPAGSVAGLAHLFTAGDPPPPPPVS